MLRSVRLAGGVFLEARFTAPWSVSAKLTAEECRAFSANPAQVIAYHFVIAGTLRLSVEGEKPIEVRAGEIVLLPRNDIHVLASAAGLPTVSAADLLEPGPDGGLARIVHGGGGQETHIVCGYLGSNEGFNPLIETLPRVLAIDAREAASRDWIEASVRFAAGELAAGRLASSDMMSRLSELLFVEAVRQFAGTLAEAEIGWLKGLRDPQVGRALAMIHRDLAAPWSAERLAREVAMSRSAFMDRFRTLVGMPPIRYLTVWRLQSARLQLSEQAMSIAQLAHAVGYESEEAFSRAFKREFGLSPAQWREREQGRQREQER